MIAEKRKLFFSFFLFMQLVLLKKVFAVSLLQSCICYSLSINGCVCDTGHAGSGVGADQVHSTHQLCRHVWPL